MNLRIDAGNNHDDAEHVHVGADNDEYHDESDDDDDDDDDGDNDGDGKHNNTDDTVLTIRVMPCCCW